MKDSTDAQLASFPLAQLSIAPDNPRQIEPDEATIMELAESIRANGLLTALIGYMDETGQVQITAGGRRLRALRLLHEGDHMVPVNVLNHVTAVTAGITEQLAHLALDALDEFNVMTSPTLENLSDDAAGRLLGRSALYVSKRRAILGSEKLTELVRTGQITVGQAVALTVLNDEDEAFEELVQRCIRDPGLTELDVRKAIAHSKPVWDRYPPAKYVTQADYLAAGGQLTGNLFSDMQIIENREIVDRLALPGVAKAVAEAHPCGHFQMVDSLHDVIAKRHPGIFAASEEEQEEYEDLRWMSWKLRDAAEDGDEEAAASLARLEELKERCTPAYPEDLTHHLVTYWAFDRYGNCFTAKPNCIPDDDETVALLVEKGYLAPAKASPAAPEPAAEGPALSNPLRMKIKRLKLHALRMELAKDVNLVLKSYVAFLNGHLRGFRAHPDAVDNVDPEIFVEIGPAFIKLEEAAAVDASEAAPAVVRSALAYHALIRLSLDAPINKAQGQSFGLFGLKAADLRRYWTPDAAFFKAYPRELLNETAQMAGIDAKDILSVKKGLLCELLVTKFESDKSLIPPGFDL